VGSCPGSSRELVPVFCPPQDPVSLPIKHPGKMFLPSEIKMEILKVGKIQQMIFLPSNFDRGVKMTVLNLVFFFGKHISP